MAKVNTDTEEDEVWDSIVIGSGIGALSCASLLAQCQTDHRVLILEQHPYHAGGCCGSFERNGYPFAVGVHYLSDMGEEPGPGRPPTLKQMIDALCAEGDPCGFTKMPEPVSSCMIGKDELKAYEIDGSRVEESLISLFPNEKENIHNYMKNVKKAAKAFKRTMMFKVLPRFLVSFLLKTGLHRLFDKGFHKFANQPMEEVVNKATDDVNLRCLLKLIGSEAGVPPDESPFLLQAIICEGLDRGTYYPTGGAGQISKKVCRAIEASGGEIRINSKVERILIEENKAVGVELASGKKLRAKQVISDAGFVNTFRNMVPAEYHPAIIKNVPPSLEEGLTGDMLFVGLQGDADKDFNIPNKVIACIPHNDVQALYANVPRTWMALQDITPEEIFVSSPSKKDGDWKKNYSGKTTLEISNLDVTWEALTSILDSNGEVLPEKQDEYKAFKTKFAKMIWSRARQALLAAGASPTLPESIEDVDFFELGTPVTFARHLGSPKGVWYGFNHNRQRFRPQTFYLDLRPDCPTLPGLYMTGQDVVTFGVEGALFGGYMCAGKLLGQPNPYALRKMVSKNRARLSKT